MVFTSGFNDRQKWVDIAKGLGIIAVAAGHSGSGAAYYLYWFHMPLFFIISGYLFKPLKDWLSVFNWSLRRTCQLLLPYISFLAIIVVVEFYLGNRAFDYKKIADSFTFNLYPGGRFIGGFYVTFWFITCLYITQIVFAVIHKTFKSSGVCLMIIGAFYLLAHYESAIAETRQIIVPWDIDVAMLTLTYYAFGFFARDVIKRLNNILSAASITFTAVLTFLSVLELFSYSINVKYGTCSNLILDLIVPVTISVALFAVSQKCSSSRASDILVTLGKYSLPIMYLHLPVNIILHNYYNIIFGPFYFVLIGLAVPTVLGILFERFWLTNLLLMGCLSPLPVPERIFSWRESRGAQPAAIKTK
ncbi:acyltransferase family protein [Pelotomaculum propionicicum]|uniref:acyltransferase family protein n=1 Tax=Pelotomaculum propionicicum TaxID=258475 RepID=UPI003B7A2092